MESFAGTQASLRMEQDYINRVETYLTGSLSKEDKKQFEKDLENDSNLQQAFQECILAIDVIDNQVAKDLKLKFTEWNQEKEKFNIWRSPILKIAASIVLVVGVFFIFFQESGSLSNEKISQKYYNLPNIPSSSLGTVDQQWSKGLEAYRKKLYDEAITAWVPIKNSSPEVNYYLAHSYFNIQDYKSAATLFEELSRGTSVYSFPSDWYLTLSYLAVDDIMLYKKNLHEIIGDKDHPFYSDANSLNQETKNEQ